MVPSGIGTSIQPSPPYFPGHTHPAFQATYHMPSLPAHTPCRHPAAPTPLLPIQKFSSGLKQAVCHSGTFMATTCCRTHLFQLSIPLLLRDVHLHARISRTLPTAYTHAILNCQKESIAPATNNRHCGSQDWNSSTVSKGDTRSSGGLRNGGRDTTSLRAARCGTRVK